LCDIIEGESDIMEIDVCHRRVRMPANSNSNTADIGFEQQIWGAVAEALRKVKKMLS